MTATQIIAHRGASRDAPENTVSAIRLGWEKGADAVELDLRLTRDRQVVAMHDDNARRTTGRDVAVADATLAELQALDAGRFKGRRWRGERIPGFAEILAAVPSGKGLVLELKAGAEILPPLEAALARGAPALKWITLIAFDPAVAASAKERMPGAHVLRLSDAYRGHGAASSKKIVRGLIAQAKRLQLDGLDLFAHPCVDRETVETIRAEGLRLFVWTVNRADQMRRFLREGVDGITTDVPDLLRTLRDGLPSSPRSFAEPQP